MQKLRWWQVVGFFVVMAAGITWQVMSREDMQGRDIEADLLAIQERACACRDRGDTACASAVGQELTALFDEQEDRRINDAQYTFFRNIVDVTEACLAEAGAPTGLELAP